MRNRAEFIVVAVAFAAVFVLAAPVRADLVGWWKMDEASWDGTADEVVDSSGTGNHGRAQNGVNTVAGRGGEWGRAGDFTGTNQYVMAPDISSASVTVTAWVNPASTANGDIVTKWFTTYEWAFDVKDNKVKVSAYSGDTRADIQGSTSLGTNVWSHIAFVYDSSAGELRVYVNGESDATPVSLASPLNQANDYTYIGRNRWAGDFNGYIDDVRIYNTALTQSQIAAIVPEPGTVFLLGTGLVFVVRRRRK